jgi:hypothetical protein
LAFLGFSVKLIGSHSTRFYGRSVQRRSLRLVPSDALVPLWARLVPWPALRARKGGPARRRRGQVCGREETPFSRTRGAVGSLRWPGFSVGAQAVVSCGPFGLCPKVSLAVRLPWHRRGRRGSRWGTSGRIVPRPSTRAGGGWFQAFGQGAPRFLRLPLLMARLGPIGVGSLQFKPSNCRIGAILVQGPFAH